MTTSLRRLVWAAEGKQGHDWLLWMPVWGALVGKKIFAACCPLEIDLSKPGPTSILEIAAGFGIPVKDESDPLEDI